MGNLTSRKKILVILGPTSSGKSDLAIKLAKKFNGEVISADSRQIYHGMDIGTGKIPRDKSREKSDFEEFRELRSRKGKVGLWTASGIPHHMIDIISPRTEYNVAKFKKQTEKIIGDILYRGKLPIICGGTGFWIKAIVDNVNFPEVKPDWNLRKKLEKKTANKLFSVLKKIDPARAKTIDAKNKVRLIRAIEICKAIKKVPTQSVIARSAATKQSQVKQENTGLLRCARNDRWDFLQIGIKLPKKIFHKNIENRVKARFKQGMIDEVERLHKQGLSWKKIQAFGLAYFWIPLYLQKKLSFGELRMEASKEKSLALMEDKLIEKVIQAEKNYAKRQITWFKRDKRIKWLENYKKIENETKKFLKTKTELFSGR